MRRCLGCSALISVGARCLKCRRAQRAKYSNGWTAIAAERVRHHVAQHGWICPGFHCEPHASHDLVVDHDMGVLCRSHNSTKRNRGFG